MRIDALNVLALLLLPSLAGAASFTSLGFLDGEASSFANGVSTDGMVVVGQSRAAVRWTSGKIERLSTFDLTELLGSYASGVSSDGSVAVGTSATGLCNNCPAEGVLWSDGSVTALGLLLTAPEHHAESAATAVSADGTTVVGYSSCTDFSDAFPCMPTSAVSSGLHLEAFRWVNGVMAGLGAVPGASHSQAFGVSANGAVVVGTVGDTNADQAFRWTDGVMTGLGYLPGGGASAAYGVSADGAIVVGQSKNSAANVEAFRWADRVMTGLGNLPGGSYSSAEAISADGSVAVGTADTAEVSGAIDREAFVWTESKGMQRLHDVLRANGATVPAGWTLSSATGISQDGKWVVGYGSNSAGMNEAFVANIVPSKMVGTDGGGGALGGFSLTALALLGLARRMQHFLRLTKSARIGECLHYPMDFFSGTDLRTRFRGQFRESRSIRPECTA